MAKKYANVTIKVTDETKRKLDSLKIIPDERMNSLIERLIKIFEKEKGL